MRWLLVAALAACHDKPAPPPAPAAPVPKADPWAGADAGPPQSREERAAAAVARASAMQPQLAKLRHLELLHPIPAEYQSKEAFRAFVHREVELDRTHEANAQAALVQLGLLPAGIDLAAAEEKAFATQAAAYYDPKQKKFFIVMVPDAPGILDITSAHELTHGLQDQHFDLKKYFAEGENGVSTLDSDAELARRFVVEGDATFTMMLYAMTDLTGARTEPKPSDVKILRAQLESMADTDAMIDSMVSATGLGTGSDDISESMRAMKDIPRAILVPMVDSYMKGALVSLDAFERGGWPAVDALYADPPESSEQVLHPKERLLGKNRDRPRKVDLPKLAGYEQVSSDVLGELMWQVYFAAWKHDGDNHVAQNWGGDRYALLRKDGKSIVIVATAWDTEYDAKLFSDAYTSTIAARLAATGHSGRIWVRRDSDRVFIVDGGEDAKLVDALATGAKIAR